MGRVRGVWNWSAWCWCAVASLVCLSGAWATAGGDTAVTRSCGDGRGFQCPRDSSQCFDGSALYCNFTVGLAKSILKLQEKEFGDLENQLHTLELKREAAERETVRVRESLQSELAKVAERVYLLQPRFLKGHYIATDSAMLIISLVASIGVAAGIFFGTIVFGPKLSPASGDPARSAAEGTPR
mmetsp:Transcript_2188/g.6322  ORF Transcript_2188/g.6322 Transcript_2188/m.6322 type:complete len:184 (-) Transcript_2188:188-739(-)